MNKFNVGDVVCVSRSMSCFRLEGRKWNTILIEAQMPLIIMSANVKDILEIFSLNKVFDAVRDERDWKSWCAILHPKHGVLCIENATLKYYV